MNDGGLVVKNSLEKLLELLLRMKEIMYFFENDVVEKYVLSDEDYLDSFFVVL